MNQNGGLGQQWGLGQQPQFIDFSKNKSVNQAAEERAAQRAAEKQQEQKTENKKSNDDVAKEIGNNILRDLGVMAYNVSIGFKKGEDGKMTPTLMAPAFEVDKLNNKKEEPKEEPKNEEPKEEEKEEEDSETIEYTYKPGDTFGQVVKDLGLESGNGLWGANGDVEYYSKQLEDQLWKSGVWEQGSRQNIPIGTTIRLKRRALTPEMQAYRDKYGYN